MTNIKYSKFKSFGRLIKETRERKGVSQADVARTLGYSTPQFVSNWERGLSTPPVNKIPQLTAYLGISKRVILAQLIDRVKSEVEASYSKFRKRAQY